MRIPFIQVTMELIEQTAPDLAVLLKVDEAKAGWGLIRTIKWALGRVPEGALPSDYDLVPGPEAAKLIARAAGHRGDPEAYVFAIMQCSHPLLEQMPDGIRFRGLDRYDPVLASATARSVKAKVAAAARWSKAAMLRAQLEDAPRMVQASPEHCSTDAQDMLGDAKTQTQTQTHIALPLPEASGAPDAEVPESPVHQGTPAPLVSLPSSDGGASLPSPVGRGGSLRSLPAVGRKQAPSADLEGDEPALDRKRAPRKKPPSTDPAPVEEDVGIGQALSEHHPRIVQASPEHASSIPPRQSTCVVPGLYHAGGPFPCPGAPEHGICAFHLQPWRSLQPIGTAFDTAGFRSWLQEKHRIELPAVAGGAR